MALKKLVKWSALLAVVGGGVAAVAKRLQGGGTDNWQSSYTPSPPPGPPSPPSSPADAAAPADPGAASAEAGLDPDAPSAPDEEAPKP